MAQGAVAVFKQPTIQGEAVATVEDSGTRIHATFTKLPSGKHGFHIHKAGDLRGDGCKGACDHWHVGPPCPHGGRPRHGDSRERHTGDLGNVELRGGVARYSYFLEGVKPGDLWGRALIIHADEDDLGRGPFEDSLTTGHSGARIGCAIWGRIMCG
jgi:Cu-Zn family superoxide dismutase